MAAEPLASVEARIGRQLFDSLSASLRDYLGLLKPRIVLLLVVTELGGMLTAARGMPPSRIVVGAVLGGAMAAGGAGAINCWFDRDIDALMPRTRRRPLPAGRILPARALVFGCAVSLCGVLLIAVSTNPLAAVLAATGGAFYVFVYTIWLKRATTQNIVIGGAAGAFPPLVGWAAASGDLTPLAWSLFALIFFWTPPHFWALALLLRGQYGAAGVPMLPAVAGSRHTRRAILAYTVLMAAVSLVPGIWLGPVYWVPAVLLGAIFLALALRAAVDQRGVTASQLFHYSLLYLALVFCAAPLASVLHG